MHTKKTADYIFVAIQLLLLALFCWQPHPLDTILPLIWKWVGMFLGGGGLLIMIAAIIQLNRSITMLPTPTDNARLITSGVFKYMRHPIYTGVFLITLGWALYTADFTRMLIALLLLLLFEIKSNYEERRLQERFPDYAGYKLTTGKFFPFQTNKK